jgi:hypothetical protein
MAYNENMKSKTDNIGGNGISLYGSESTVGFNYFNGGVSVRICPIKPEEERTPKSMYDYNVHTNIIVPKDDCLYLAWMLKNVFLPKLQAGEYYFQGIRIGRANMIAFDTGENGDKPSITIYRDLDPATLRAKESRRFVFRPVTTLSKYDPEAGEYTPDKHHDIDVIKMLGFFEQAANLCGAVYHNYRFEGRFADRARRQLINSMAGKLGIAQDHPVNIDRDAGFGYGGGFDSVPAISASNASSEDVVMIERADDVSTLENLV